VRRGAKSSITDTMRAAAPTASESIKKCSIRLSMNKHRITDAHAKRDFRIFRIVIHRISSVFYRNKAQQSRPPRHVLQSFSYFQTVGVWGCFPISEQNAR
jgi:hypothetical protein